jgi:hypothetical protein
LRRVFCLFCRGQATISFYTKTLHEHVKHRDIYFSKKINILKFIFRMKEHMHIGLKKSAFHREGVIDNFFLASGVIDNVILLARPMGRLCSEERTRAEERKEQSEHLARIQGSTKAFVSPFATRTNPVSAFSPLRLPPPWPSRFS